jgi:CRP-like cAMP-binding protein
MGQMANARTLQKLLPYLTHPSDEVRLETIIALEAMPDDVVLPQEDSLGLVEQMSRLLKDPVERIRQAALVILGRTNKREAYRAMVNALTDSSPLVRTTSADVLVRAGRAVIPLVHPCLDSPDPDLRKMAAVILSRVNRHEFGPLISSQITGNLLTIYSNYGYLNVLSAYQGYTSIVVLQNTLYEQNQRLLDEIFYLLTALHNPESIAVIAESFRNSSSRTRANALEAFETLTTPQMAKLVGPLFDPEAEPDYLLRLSRETWEMVHPDATDVVTKLTFNTPDTWLRAIMIFGLGEIGATIWGRESPPTSPKPSPAKSRPAPPTGLLDVLESLEDNKTTSTGKKRPRRSAHLLDTLADTDDTEAGGVKSRRSRRKRAVDPLAALTDETEGAGPTPEAASPSEPEDKQTDIPLPFKTRTELEAVIKENITASETEIRMAARSAQRMLAGVQIVQARLEAHAASRLIGASPDNGQIDEEEFMLSTIEKVIFLKKVPFFQSMTIDQLKAIATVCEEELFEEDTVIFEQDDLGGTLYVIVSGKVGIEHEGTRKGSVVRVATLGAHSYFGEMTLFDNSPRTASAIALQDTLTLRLRHEPVVALARQHPGLSLELIKVLSQRLRESNNQIASLTRSKPRALQKLYDSLE